MRHSNANASSRAKRKAGLPLWALALLGTLIIAFVVAGCGSSSDSSSSGSTSGGESTESAEPTESGESGESSEGGDDVAEAEAFVEKAEEEVTGGVPTSS